MLRVVDKKREGRNSKNVSDHTLNQDKDSEKDNYSGKKKKKKKGQKEAQKARKEGRMIDRPATND